MTHLPPSIINKISAYARVPKVWDIVCVYGKNERIALGGSGNCVSGRRGENNWKMYKIRMQGKSGARECAFFLYLLLFCTSVALPRAVRTSIHTTVYTYTYVYDNMYVFFVSLYIYIEYCVFTYITRAIPRQTRWRFTIYIYIHIIYCICANGAVLQWISRFFPLFSFLFHSSFPRTTPALLLLLL